MMFLLKFAHWLCQHCCVLVKLALSACKQMSVQKTDGTTLAIGIVIKHNEPHFDHSQACNKQTGMVMLTTPSGMHGTDSVHRMHCIGSGRASAACEILVACCEFGLPMKVSLSKSSCHELPLVERLHLPHWAAPACQPAGMCHDHDWLSSWSLATSGTVNVSTYCVSSKNKCLPLIALVHTSTYHWYGMDGEAPRLDLGGRRCVTQQSPAKLITHNFHELGRGSAAPTETYLDFDINEVAPTADVVRYTSGLLRLFSGLARALYTIETVCFKSVRSASPIRQRQALVVTPGVLAVGELLCQC